MEELLSPPALCVVYIGCHGRTAVLRLGDGVLHRLPEDNSIGLP
jgi:hypothetical protein